MNKKNSNLLEILISNWPAKIISLALALLLMHFYHNSLLDTRYVSLPLHIKNSGSLLPASEYPSSVQISLQGDATEITTIQPTDLYAFIDIDMYSKANTYSIPVQIQLQGIAQTIKPLAIQAQPAKIKLFLDNSISKKIPVSLHLEGAPADGYEIKTIRIEPTTLHISGPETQLKHIHDISTQSIILDGRQTNFSGNVSVELPNDFISINGSNTVHYSFTIQEKIKTAVYNTVPIALVDLPTHLELEAELPTGTLQIKGKENFINMLTLPENALQINAATIKKPGIYDVDVTPFLDDTLDDTIEVLHYSPKTLRIQIKQKE